MRPRLLDLFCGVGGCSVGYARAGFDVVGVDIKPQKNYPFRFVQADAIAFAGAEGGSFDVIHASPPCQAYSVTRHVTKRNHVGSVAEVREALREINKPLVIENVIGAPLVRPIMLCGLMFGLRVLRHRVFESSQVLLAPEHPKHPSGILTGSSRGYSTGAHGLVTVGGHNFKREAGAAAMKVDWKCTRAELAQAIPPAYTEWIGRQLLQQVENKRRELDRNEPGTYPA